jgi:uncharacterized surface protein with fasciclin (FAS1) repeats
MTFTVSTSVGVAAIWALTIITPSTGIASGPASRTLADFSAASAAKEWISVNDGVMGGVSEGGFRITDDMTLEFSGNLSLENQGGFTSIRSRPGDLDLGGYDRIALRLKGDGRTYSLNLMTSSRSAASSYRAPIRTEKGIWQEVRVDMKDFRYTSFGRIVEGAPPLKARDIRSLGITLADKKAGPFRLEIDWMKAERGTAGEEAVPVRQSTGSPGLGDIVDTAASAGSFNTLVAAVKAAGLVETLKGPGPFTVFAPSDEAFAKLPKGMVESLLEEENRANLIAILKYHVVSGEISLGGLQIKTLQGGELDIRPGGKTRVDESNVVLADVRATNGIVHIIDRVLLPELPEPTPARRAMGVIELAIERGVPLYNAHNSEACAAIYEIAVKSLLEGHRDALDSAARQRLRQALSDIRKDHRASRQAWTLRYALDDVYGSLRDRQ